VTDRVRGNVINVHALGAMVRLEDGRLAAAPLIDVNKHRPTYVRAVGGRTLLSFDLSGRAVHLAVEGMDPIQPTAEAEPSTDATFEAQLNDYLKQTEEWAPADRPQPFERHLFRKRARAQQFRGDVTP
jgi:hypothetical protein